MAPAPPLPAEILLAISALLTSKADLCALARTTRFAYAVLNPVLYAAELAAPTWPRRTPFANQTWADWPSLPLWCLAHARLDSLAHALAAGLSVEHRDQNTGVTLLEAAAMAGDAPAMRFLAARGASGTKALVAIMGGGCGRRRPGAGARRRQLRMVRVLLEGVKDLDALSCDGRTLLHVAVSPGVPMMVEMVELLLEMGASTEIVDRPHGMTPLQLLVRRRVGLRGRREAILALQRGGAEMHGFELDADEEERGIVARIVKWGAEERAYCLNKKCKGWH